MGVKDLWPILDPLAEEVSIAYLYGKAVAIDLSAWVCDSQAVGQSHRSIQRPDLRNTFFRASRLVLSNIKPIFILEGDAPELKHATIRMRNASQHSQSSQQSSKSKKPRSQYQSRLKPMLHLLDAMGLPYVQSNGEAEKLCAFLNKEGIVEAVISQDSDCLLYGAKNVLRHFSVAKGSGTARRYGISETQAKMGLDRESLVVLSLLLGCDYCPGGVPGVGREQAISYLAGLKSSPLKRIRSWRSDPHLRKLELERVEMSQPRNCTDCWHAGTVHKHTTKGCLLCCTSIGCVKRKSALNTGDSQSRWQLLELQIRAKAMLIPDFPSEQIIKEFLDDDIIWDETAIRWKEPNIQQLLDISTKLLGWERSDSIVKVLQLVTRWHCQQGVATRLRMPQLTPANLLKLRVQQGIRCVEVQWTANSNFPLCSQELAAFTTLEPVSVFSQAYPDLYGQFELAKLASKKKCKKAAPKKKTVEKCEVCGLERDINSARNGHICQFVQKTVTKAAVNLLEEMMSELELDESVPEHELSDILSGIVSRGAMSHHVDSCTSAQYLGKTLHNLSVDKKIPEQNEPLAQTTNSVKDDSSSRLVCDKDFVCENKYSSHISVADMSVDDKENTATCSTLSQVDSLYNASTTLGGNYDYLDDFGNVSYRDDYNMHQASTPQNNKNRKPSIPQCNFSLGLESLLNCDMSWTD